MASLTFTERLLHIASRIYPASFEKRFTMLLKEADIEIPAKLYLGTAAIVLFLTVAVSLVFSTFMLGILYAIGIAILAALAVMVLFYLVPLMAADTRAKQVELVLPDAFMMIAANIRAGMTIENAILASAKPEFGPLEMEIKRISTKIFAGTSLHDALLDMGERVRSNALKRGITLLLEGNALGGQMASLLYEIAQDLREQKTLQREISNATMMYTIFIVFSTLLASPILFATSVQYSMMSAKITASVGEIGELPSGAMSFGSAEGILRGPIITPDELKLFAVACITVTTFFAAFTLAQVRTGKLLSGIRYVPVFVLAGLGMFFGALYGLQQLFGSIA
ncbi:MAG: type II secretion system F family protein [Candidatus Burarchaeum sp.]|nr:type II secretion system F family protein [Candidatus Burarchaeum sp.]MDO8339739.1 type II secretion system F family protein [Candidatus Burarchaeum sp.]